jgi:hypothetical protein
VTDLLIGLCGKIAKSGLSENAKHLRTGEKERSLITHVEEPALPATGEHRDWITEIAGRIAGSDAFHDHEDG